MAPDLHAAEAGRSSGVTESDESHERAVGWRPVWRRYGRRRLVHCWDKRLITSTKASPPNKATEHLQEKNEEKNAERVNMQSRGLTVFSRQTCIANWTTIKSRRAGSPTTLGKWKTCREGSVTKSKLGTVSVFNRPLRQDSVGFKLGSRRAKLVEQCGGIAALVTERRMTVKRPDIVIRQSLEGNKALGIDLGVASAPPSPSWSLFGRSDHQIGHRSSTPIADFWRFSQIELLKPCRHVRFERRVASRQ